MTGYEPGSLGIRSSFFRQHFLQLHLLAVLWGLTWCSLTVEKEDVKKMENWEWKEDWRGEVGLVGVV
jgi:hypothetical protein